MHIRPTVLLPLASRRRFLDAYSEQGGVGSVFVPGHVDRPVGIEVDLEIAFAEEQMVFHVRGVIRSKRLVGRRDLPAGIGIELMASERATQRLLLDFANGGGNSLVRRRSRRLPVVIDVESGTGGSIDATSDLSREGAFIRTESPAHVGTILHLKLRPPGGGTIEVRAEVRWQRQSERPGMGVRFLFDGPSPQRLIAEFIDKVKGQLSR